MKRKHLISAILSIILVISLTSCGKKDPTSSSLLEKSSLVIMKTNAKQDLSLSTTDVSVKGGSLDIQTALLIIEKFKIEENSGYEGEQEGEHQDNDGGNDGEFEVPDIIVTGPFTMDISKGEAFIDSVAVYPGTFKNVDLTFSTNPAAPFNNKSIVIEGVFTPTTGAAVSFFLQSEFMQVIQSNIARNGITIAENATIPVVVTFDLAGFFKNMDFGAAQVVDGKILIDSNNNSALLTTFEANLGNYIDVEEESNESQ